MKTGLHIVTWDFPGGPGAIGSTLAGVGAVLIGGSGERKTLRLVAKYADACNLFSTGPDEVAHKLDVLRAHCDTEGRDYDTITKTMLSRSNPADVDAVVEEMQAFATLGIDKVIFVPSGDPVAFTRRLGGELAARLEEL
jgi:hypothetical protein